MTAGARWHVDRTGPSDAPWVVWTDQWEALNQDHELASIEGAGFATLADAVAARDACLRLAADPAAWSWPTH